MLFWLFMCFRVLFFNHGEHGAHGEKHRVFWGFAVYAVFAVVNKSLHFLDNPVLKNKTPQSIKSRYFFELIKEILLVQWLKCRNVGRMSAALSAV